jgi:hypothetical protein
MCAVNDLWSSTASGETMAAQIKKRPTRKLLIRHNPMPFWSWERVWLKPRRYVNAVSDTISDTRYDPNSKAWWPCIIDT